MEDNIVFDFEEKYIKITKLGKVDTVLFEESSGNKIIYPASISKIFIGAEILRQVEEKKLNPLELLTATENNIVDTSLEVFLFDQRPLIQKNKKYSIEYLLDLMLSRSDNTASNILIGKVTRESINKEVILKYGWNKSILTRKYGSRLLEEEQYKNAPVMECSTEDIHDFFCKLAKDAIISPFVSETLKKYLKHYTNEQFLSCLPKNTLVYYKGGKYTSINYHNQTVKWIHYACIVVTENDIYSITVFTLTKDLNSSKVFNTDAYLKNIFTRLNLF